MLVSEAAKLSKACNGNEDMAAIRSHIAIGGALLGVQFCVFAAAIAFFHKLSRESLLDFKWSNSKHRGRAQP